MRARTRDARQTLVVVGNGMVGHHFVAEATRLGLAASYRLTVFADNLLPHVLRLDGVLIYEPALARLVDQGRLLRTGSRMEREIRACTVHACEQLAMRLEVPPRTLDNWLWNRGRHRPTASDPRT